MKAALPHVLVVDDDERIRTLICKYLRDNNFVCVAVENTAAAEQSLAFLKFDIIILDVMMPDETGVQFLARLRQTSQIPVLMLTAQSEVADRITGLETGADDYLAKPFEPKELVLRIRSILKRSQTNALDIPGLTTAEETLLKILYDNPGKAFSREEIAAKLGNSNERAIDVQIARLRKKLEDAPDKNLYIQSVRGVGYKLNV